ncbi:hypothetical protein [Ponticoccus sp. (in: a-proteobacteria)]|uniref:hypothetical protein n=1 Tax=Ponticoccus sp. (in: a-proteobacteria) TaxID=1925025 RepID=UPI003AB140F7
MQLPRPSGSPVDRTAARSAAENDTAASTPAVRRIGAPAVDDETAFRLTLRLPWLGNIGLRDLTGEMRQILRGKPRGISIQEVIALMWQRKCAGYGQDFSVQQIGDAVAGKKFKSGSAGNPPFLREAWT